ncbi:MAG: rod-binding protein [Acetobacterales bacterium]
MVEAGSMLQNLGDSLQGNRVDAARRAVDMARDGDGTSKTLVDFEAMFLSQMLGHMFAGIETDGLFGGGQAEKTFRGLLVEEYGKIMASSGGVGLADSLQKELLMTQEVASK